MSTLDFQQLVGRTDAMDYDARNTYEVRTLHELQDSTSQTLVAAGFPQTKQYNVASACAPRCANKREETKFATHNVYFSDGKDCFYDVPR